MKKTNQRDNIIRVKERFLFCTLNFPLSNHNRRCCADGQQSYRTRPNHSSYLQHDIVAIVNSFMASTNQSMDFILQLLGQLPTHSLSAVVTDLEMSADFISAATISCPILGFLRHANRSQQWKMKSSALIGHFDDGVSRAIVSDNRFIYQLRVPLLSL